MSRCTYVVPEKSLAIRSHRNHDPDIRCRRQAVMGGLCRQHAAVHAAHQDRLWATHRQIVQRILEIPARD